MSGKCYNCDKTKQVQMVVSRAPQDIGCDEHDACEQGPCKRQRIEYLCAPCRKELGY